MLARLGRRAPFILAVAFLDELASAVPSAGAPGVRASFPNSYAWLAAALLGLPTIAGLVLEAPLLALSDRWRQKHLVLAASLGVMGAAFVGVGVSTSLFAVACWMAIAFPAAGIAGALAEATLIGGCESDAARARAMTRWTIAGALGDTVGPIVLALALGWRGGSAVIGAVILAVALAIVVARPSTASAMDEPEEGREPLWRESIGVLRRGPAMAWLAAAALCTLLDETLIAFAALHWDALAETRGYGRLTVGTLLAAFSMGAGVSLVVVDAVIARRPAWTRQLLTAACVSCVASYAVWLQATGPVWGTITFFIAGASAGPLWPLTQARVYDLFPDRVGLAGAAGTLFAPLDVVAPIVVGLVADRAGVTAALTILLLQPVGILAILALSTANRGR